MWQNNKIKMARHSKISKPFSLNNFFATSAKRIHEHVSTRIFKCQARTLMSFDLVVAD